MSSKKQRNLARRKEGRRESALSKRAPARRFWSLATLSDTPLAALAITMIVYLRCLENGLVYDDHEMIILNRYIGDWAMVWRSFVNDSWWFRNPLSLPQSAYYRPLQDVWLAMNYHLFGLAPVGWHLAIVAVHLIAVYLVFEVARELGGSRWTPTIAATVFGVLPIHAQAVIWPTAIPLPMSAVFELASFLFFIRSGRGAAPKFLAPVLFAMALLSHESAVVFPLIIVAYGVLIGFAPNPCWRERLVRAGVATMPFFIEVAIYLVIRREVLGFITRLNITNPMTPAQGWLTVPNALGTYAMILIMPWRAGPAHPVDAVSSIRASQFYLPLLALIGLATSGAVALWNDSRRMTYLFWAIWIAVSIVPVLDLRAFSPLALVEDRYLYMASVGWCIALTDIAVAFFISVDASGRMLAAAASTVIIAFGASLFHVESYWHDEVALFGTCVEMAPRSTLCHDRLGLALKSRGDKEDAEREFLIAQELDPNDAANLYNLGLVHAEMGRSDEAIGELKRALAGLPDAPPVAYVDLAKLADAIGKNDERDEALRRAEKLPEGDVAVDLGRAQMAITHGDFPSAESLAREATSKDPRIPDGWELLGIALMKEGRMSDALTAYEEALKLKPNASLERTVLALRARVSR